MFSVTPLFHYQHGRACVTRNCGTDVHIIDDPKWKSPIDFGEKNDTVHARNGFVYNKCIIFLLIGEK